MNALQHKPHFTGVTKNTESPVLTVNLSNNLTINAKQLHLFLIN